jgi:hypothetical protein
MSEQLGTLREGARRVWRYQRVLWGIFIANLVLGYLGAFPLSARLSKMVGHSAEMQNLANGFDLGTFRELTLNPDVDFWSGTISSVVLACIFFLVTLFLTGGVLEAYRANRKLPMGEFFEACGAFFWRWVRLLIFMVIILVPIAIAAAAMSDWSATLSSDAPQEKLGFWVDLAGLALVLLLMMSVRLWFDMAQVCAVAEDEPAMGRALLHALRLTSRNFGALFWLYLRISLSAWLVLALTLWLWVHIPGRQTGLIFLVFELMLLWWIGSRLWQRASETVWYERNAESLVLAMSESVPEAAHAVFVQPPV